MVVLRAPWAMCFTSSHVFPPWIFLEQQLVTQNSSAIKSSINFTAFNLLLSSIDSINYFAQLIQ
ncbi:hypothetical protein Syun_008960 [Stephania yunnanensis]|uniref:Uncharacterized protein n=1 Tax=Stephania yunnanensis TaxID=152371 RepID=A0AAP0KDH8_9MAGN